MMVTIDSESIAGVVIGVANGQLTLEEMRQAAATVWEGRSERRMRILWDLREAHFNLLTNEVRDLADFVKRHSPFGDLRTAFVVASDLEFGLIRMFEIYRGTESAKVAVFRDKDAALEWLAKDTDSQ